MALSDCDSCWSTPCECSSFKESDEERAFRYAWKEAKEAREAQTNPPLPKTKCTCAGCIKNETNTATNTQSS